jgi:PAS domain S-box-containing protein
VKLALRLTILFALLAIIPVIAVGYLAYDSGRRAIEEEVGNHLLSTNLLKGNELDRWIDGNKSSIEELAQRPLVVQYSSVLSSHDSASPAYNDAHGKLVDDHLRPRIKSIGGFTELFVICPVHGIILASSDQSQEGKYRDAQPYYLQGRIQTNVYGVFYSSSFEQLTMVIGTPVRDKQGNLLAVLAGRLDLSELSSIMLAQSGLSETEDTYLVNNFGFFVTEPRFGKDYALKKTVRTEGVEAGQSGKNGVGYYTDYRNEPVIGAYKWLPAYNMVMITEVDQAEAYAPIRQMAAAMGFIMLAVMLIVVIAGFLTASTVTRPVRRLVAGAEKIGHGDLNYRVGTKSGDEIGILSRAFDRMAEELQATTVSRNELIASEEKYRLIIENSRDMIFTTNSRGELVYVSPAFKRMMGYDLADMQGRTVSTFLHPDDVAKVEAAFRNNIKMGEFAVALEYRVKHISGQWCWHITNGNRVLDADGSFLYFVGIAHDITERKQVTESLRVISLRQEAILAAVPDIIAEVDENKVYTWANRAAVEFFGEEMVGKEASYYFEGEQPTYDVVQPLFKGDENVIYVESWQRRKDGKKRLLAWWCRVLKDEKGNVKGALSSAQDITERKQVEEAIRKLNEELEQRVRERTALLEAANRELEAFSYSVSHDLRSPLRAISGYTRMLVEDYQAQLDAEGTRICSVITESAKNMGTLIDDLLDFSRLGRSDMHVSNVDMATMANSIFYELTRPEERERIDFSVGPLPQAFADPSLMRQVWTNLLSNAIKFASHKERTIIEVNGKSYENETIYSVQDNGAGFDMQYVEKLFGVFQRLHSSDEFEGNGVGLAIVQRIVHRHGGRVWAMGEVDKGAVFDFTLPRKGG